MTHSSIQHIGDEQQDNEFDMDAPMPDVHSPEIEKQIAQQHQILMQQLHENAGMSSPEEIIDRSTVKCYLESFKLSSN